MSRCAAIGWGMVGVTSMLMVGFVLLSLWMTWQHESVLKQLVPMVVQLQQAQKPPTASPLKDVPK